ncbi:MAG: hypothetical protein Q4D32_09835, partial [Eubacteriales bacterium]|nr:hypothetical protein [Eubacteriales bacterium]
MKKKIGLMAIIACLCLGIIMLILYLIELRTWIPEEWQEISMWVNAGANYTGDPGYLMTMHYPRQVADHFVACFLGIYYLLFGYLLFERKHYCGCVRQQESNKIRLWMGLAVLCQIGVVCVYAFLWLAYTDVPQKPASTPRYVIY